MDDRGWMLTYSNLMTIFLVLFILLYVFSSYVDAEQYEKVINVIQTELGGEVDTGRLEKIMNRKEEEELGKFLNKFIDEKGIKKFAEVKIEKDDIKVVFAEPLVFNSGRADLKPDVMPLLERLGELVKKMPNEVVVEGHTDNLPLSSSSEYNSNWELSLDRAFSIVHYFTKIEGVPARRFIPVGYGEYKPVAPNDSLENRAKNRRIEIRIKRTEA